ncbi:hypothetical protein ACHAWU_003949 [Discostella pseudostelligera]|uniref:Uncharacterized protein n=1 Tax=Discostella pseudostelligera TaxID=259834 RepID=A0ABD3MPK1_9STRA
MQRTTPTTTAFINRRNCISILRGGDDRQEDSVIQHDNASQEEDSILSDRHESIEDGNTIQGKGDAWEEEIRKTREYYSSVQSSKSSSKILATPTTSMAATTVTAIINDTTTTTPTENNGEDGRVFGNTACDSNSLQDNGEGGCENGDRENLTSKSIIEIGESEASEIMDDGASTIYDEIGEPGGSDIIMDDGACTVYDDDNNIINAKEGDVKEDWQNELEEVGQNVDDVTFGNEEEQETAADGINLTPRQEAESSDMTKDDDVDNEVVGDDGDVPPPLVDLEDGQADVEHEIHDRGIEERANEDFAAEDSYVEEGQALGDDLETTVTEVNNDVLAGENEQDDDFTTTDDKTPSQDDVLGSNYDNDVEALEVEAINTGDKLKGVAAQFIRRFQRRISTLIMTVRRKETKPIILASLGVALSVLLNSVRVNKNSSDDTTQTFKFQPNDDVSPDLNDDLPNIEEDEDSDETITSPAPQEQADLDRTWLDKLLSFVGQPSRA